MWNRQDEKGVDRVCLHLAERQNDQSWEVGLLELLEQYLKCYDEVIYKKRKCI